MKELPMETENETLRIPDCDIDVYLEPGRDNDGVLCLELRFVNQHTIFDIVAIPPFELARICNWIVAYCAELQEHMHTEAEDA